MNKSYEYNSKLFNHASYVAKEYGIFSKRIVKHDYIDNKDTYLVFSLEPIDEDINPIEVINRNNRNQGVFYPHNFAININEENPLIAWERIISYLSSAEFLYELYEEFHAPLPRKIRVDELEALISHWCGRKNQKFDSQTREHYAKNLIEFFRQETSRGKFLSEWQDFYRSELFDEKKSFINNLFIFLRRKEPEVKLKVLLASNYELRKAYIPEHYYNEFRNIIKEKYPDVKYHISKKQIVDKGIIIDPKTKLAVNTQFGLTVTDKQYDKIRERRFSEEGFACLDGLNLSYYEGRKIFYVASDENIIASVLNNIRLRWAKCIPLQVLLERGEIEGVNIPYSQMMNFYVSLKQHNIPFVVDNDVNSNTNLEFVRILYNTEDAEIVGKLSAGLTWANITLSHVKPEEVPFNIDIKKTEEILNKADVNVVK